MAGRPKSASHLVLPVLLVLFCFFAGFLLWGTSYISQSLKKEFGPPGSNLSITQQLIYSIRLVLYESDIITPVDPSGKSQEFQVATGETVASIAERLEAAHLVHSGEAFQVYLIYTGLDTEVKAGKYQLSPALSSMDIAHALLDATPSDVDFYILPGWRAEEIAALLPTSGLNITPDDFLQVVRDPSGITLPQDLQDLKSLEGFLYPDHYVFRRSNTLNEMLETILKRFDDQVPQTIRSGFIKQGLTLYQGVTMASIIQRESPVDDQNDRRKIAAVYYNRLNGNIKLQSDPTVQYALGYNTQTRTWWTNPLSSVDLDFDSTYNTYMYPGLPPGPISNPGLGALHAAAFPMEGVNYYFFRARCDGSGLHNFAATYEEHLKNACP